MTTVSDITCREVVELVTLYLDGEMPEDERARFEQHLAICEGCAVYVEQMRETARLVRTAAEREAALTPEARDALMGAFRSWKQP